MSLLADDWRQSREDLEAEREGLEELLVDLEADSAGLSLVRTRLERHDRDAMWIYQRLGAHGVDMDSAAVHWSRLHGLGPYQAQRSAYTALLTTGRLGLIRDKALRRQIVRYYEDLQPDVVSFLESYGDLWYNFREVASRDAEFAFDAGTESFGELDRGGVRFRTEWSEIPTDPTLTFRLNEVGILATVTANRAAGVLAENARLRTAILGHLDR